MQEVYDRVCQMGSEDDRAAVINIAWEGIGGWCG
jgi:hypothetical protein